MEAQWSSGSVSRFYATGPGFKSQAWQGWLSLSFLQRVDKMSNKLVCLGNQQLSFALETDHLAGASVHPPQCPRSQKLRWAQWALAFPWLFRHWV
ncbi:hypothetical protein TNCV_89471 [Trichonephila clavipes]|nr:hypothetical protein TNCV_89471 [Trichonephila clavipes]